MLSTYLNIADLGVEVKHGADLNGSSEPDVVHMQTPGTAFAFTEMSCTLVSNGYWSLMSKWWKLPKTWALAQPNSNACLMMNPPKILLNLNVNFLSSPFFLTPQQFVWLSSGMFTCFCSEVGKQSGFSTWRLQTRQSWQALPWLMERFVSFTCFVLHLYFLPSFERHGLVVDGVQEKVMDKFLRKKNTSDYVFSLCCTSSSSWGGTLKRESWEIWYLLHNTSVSK